MFSLKHPCMCRLCDRLCKIHHETSNTWEMQPLAQWNTPSTARPRSLFTRVMLRCKCQDLMTSFISGPLYYLTILIVPVLHAMFITWSSLMRCAFKWTKYNFFTRVIAVRNSWNSSGPRQRLILGFATKLNYSRSGANYFAYCLVVWMMFLLMLLMAPFFIPTALIKP